MILTCLCFFGHRLQSRRERYCRPYGNKKWKNRLTRTPPTPISPKRKLRPFGRDHRQCLLSLVGNTVDDLQTGIQPYYWIWIAAPEQEAVLDDFTEPTSLRKRSIHTAATAASCPTRHIQKRCPGRPGSYLGERKPSPGKKLWDSKNPHDLKPINICW